jgi:hypothetical protein
LSPRLERIVAEDLKYPFVFGVEGIGSRLVNKNEQIRAGERNGQA